MTRRELLANATAAVAATKLASTAPGAITKVPAYPEDRTATFGRMFDQPGGLAKLVNNKTVTIKLNLTGAPALWFQGTGAKRIRLVESCQGTGGPMEEYMLDSGWNVRQLKSLSKALEFENTNAMGSGSKYARSGVTLSMKNCFGNTAASIYGDDAGLNHANESPTWGCGDVCHFGKRQPSKDRPVENDAASRRFAEFIDGIESMVAGERPQVGGQRSYVRPGVLVPGTTNAVTTDSVATAGMGYGPRAGRSVAPFDKCDNLLLLAEAHGIGTTDLKRIEVHGVSTLISDARFLFPGSKPV